MEKYKQIESGGIPEGWVATTLGEVAESISQTFDFSEKEEAIFINTGDILSGNFLHKDYSKVNTLPGQAKKTIMPNDILLSEIRPANKRYALVDFSDTTDYVVSTKLMVIRAKGNILPEFLYRILTNGGALAEFQHVAESRSGTFPQITFDSIKGYPLFLPSRSEQRAIAKILSELDAKIELNRQMNKTLESITQAIFKRWFVDFEFPNEHGKPYKLSGGKMIDLELGEIPADWKVDSATQLFRLEYGWHLPEWDRKEGNVPVFGSGGLTGYHNSHFVDGPGIIIGRAGKVGVDSVYYSHSHFCPIETTFYVLVENKKIIRYLYLFFKTLNTVNTGSSVPNLSRRDIHNAKIIIPKVELIEKFDKISEKVFDFIENKKNETQFLIQIRDSLLPKLMSGRIKVAKCYSRMSR